MNENGHGYEILQVDKTSQKGVSLWALFNVLAFILFVAAFGFAYLAVMDRINGLDAYRNKAILDQRKEFHETCKINFDNAENLKEWIRQKNLKPPAEFMLQRQCSELPSFEKKEH